MPPKRSDWQVAIQQLGNDVIAAKIAGDDIHAQNVVDAVSKVLRDTRLAPGWSREFEQVLKRLILEQVSNIAENADTYVTHKLREIDKAVQS